MEEGQSILEERKQKSQKLSEEYDKEPIAEVLAEYGIDKSAARLLVYKGKKGVWWISGDTHSRYSSSELVLKKVSSSEATLRFLIAGVRHLVGNGVRIPELVRTRDGLDFVKIDKTCFVLSKAVSGRKLEADRLTDIMTISAELGNFHKASSGFHCPFGAKQKNHLGTWIEEYERFLESMNTYYTAERENRSRTQTSNLIVREFPYFYDRARNVLDGLRGEEYHEWVRAAHRDGSLCHQDFSPANLILAEDGLYVLDTDSLTIDIAARDLRKLMNKLLKRSRAWDPMIADQILSAYETRLRLSIAQKKVVALDLTFPHLFLGAMDKYVYKRDKTWTEDSYYARLNEMALFERSKGMLMLNQGLSTQRHFRR